MSKDDPSHDMTVLLDRVSKIQLSDLDCLRDKNKKDGKVYSKYGSYEDLILLFLRSCSNVQGFQELLTRVSNANKLRTGYGKTLLHIAAKENPQAIISLVRIGCNVSAKDSVFSETALHVACRYGNVDSIVSLIQAGADVNSLNGSGQTPMDVFLSICRNPMRNSMERSRLTIAHTLARIGFKVSQKCQGNRHRQGRKEKIQYTFNKVKSCGVCNSLQHICRLRVRALLPSDSFEETVWSLDIAATLKDFLLYRPCVLDRHVICPHLAKEFLCFPMEKE